MTFGADFFKIVQFVIAIMRLIARIFGNETDKELDDKFGTNCLTEVDKTVKSYAPSKK